MAAAASGSAGERQFRLCVRVDKMAKIAKTHEGKASFPCSRVFSAASLPRLDFTRFLPRPVVSLVGCRARAGGALVGSSALAAQATAPRNGVLLLHRRQALCSAFGSCSFRVASLFQAEGLVQTARRGGSPGPRIGETGVKAGSRPRLTELWRAQFVPGESGDPGNTAAASRAAPTRA